MNEFGYVDFYLPRKTEKPNVYDPQELGFWTKNSFFLKCLYRTNQT